MRTGTRPSAGTASFAHLIAPTRAAATRAEDETEDDRKEREDKERAKNEKETGRAETDDEREQREEKERDEEARAAENDGDEESDDEEMRGNGSIARARSRERARIRAILSAPEAARNVAMACELACNTTMTRDEALRVLSKAPAAGNADRAARNPTLAPGSRGGAASGGSGTPIQAAWDEAFARANGKRQAPASR